MSVLRKSAALFRHGQLHVEPWEEVRSKAYPEAKCATCAKPFTQMHGNVKYCTIHRDQAVRPRLTSAEQREAHRLRMLSRKRAGATRAAMKHWWGQFTPEQRQALVARRMKKGTPCLS